MKFHRNGIYFFLVVSSMLFVSACDADTKSALLSYESEKYSFTRFLEGIKKFPYTADQSKFSKVREGFKRLSPEMQKDDIKKIMGEPDYEMFHYKPKQNDKELIYSTWGYYLKRFERNLSKQDFDKAVVLYFKPSEQLYWAEPSGIADLKPLGGPHLYPDASIAITNR